MATFVLVVSFSACKKDGVYNPSKKIAAIYRTMEDEPSSKGASKELIATYVWDGNLLSQIIYNDDDPSTYTYTYNNKKQLIAVDMDSEGSIRVEYDGKNVEGVSFSMNNAELLDVQYIRKGNQIIGADVEVSTDLLEELLNKKHSKVIRDALGIFLPYQMDIAFTQTMEQYAQHYSADSKGSLKGHIDYEWNGKNVTKASFDMSIIITSVQITSIYEYDNQINPFSGGMMANGESIDTDILGMFHGWMNVNNITKSTVAMNVAGETETSGTTCTYEYDSDKYPVKVITRDLLENYKEDYYEYK
jgi:YD repeat-containing protein